MRLGRPCQEANIHFTSHFTSRIQIYVRSRTLPTLPVWPNGLPPLGPAIPSTVPCLSPRFRLLSFATGVGAKLPTGGNLCSRLGVPCGSLCIIGLAYAPSPRTLLSIVASSAFCLARAAAFACAADSGRNCLKSSKRSGAVLNRCVTCE